MSDNTKILVRNAREQDIPTVVEIDTEAFSPSESLKSRNALNPLTAFPDGFIIMVQI